MLLARGGSEAAFEVVVRRYLPRLTRYAAKMTGSTLEGEEIAQEALVRTWQSRLQYQPRSAFPVFVFTVALNLCRNSARSASRRARWQEPAGQATDAGHDPAQVDRMIER